MLALEKYEYSCLILARLTVQCQVMNSPSLHSREPIISSPTLRKNSQADNVIYGDIARTRPRTGESLNPQRFFKRSTWSRSPDPRSSTVNQVHYSPAPSFIVSPHSTRAPAKPLTETLLEYQPYLLELATRAPFLVAAGTGNLPRALLSRWLSQERLYAQAYIGFIGALISRVDLPYAHVGDKRSSLRWRIIQMLTTSLSNIQRQLEIFEEVAKRYSLNLELSTKPDIHFTAEIATKQYIDLFRAFWTDPTMTLLEGLVIHWATEYCRMMAWKYARSLLNPGRRDDLDGGALRDELMLTWTSDEFQKLVNETTECTNLLADREEAGFKLETFKAVWTHVLNIQRKFWPEM